MIRLLSVVGARPNFMKIAPIVEELKQYPSIEHCLVHSGQHYDELLSGNFFADLGLPMPDVNLEVGPLHSGFGGQICHLFKGSDKFRPTIRVSAVVERVNTDENICRAQRLGPGERIVGEQLDQVFCLVHATSTTQKLHFAVCQLDGFGVRSPSRSTWSARS